MAYDFYTDIKNVYNAKVGWNQATTDEERQKQNELATNARKRLEENGYADIASQISAAGADATKARQIMEQYAPKQLTDTELITKNNNEVNTKVNQLWGIQENDRNTMTDKYSKLEETAYSNPFTTDEAKAIIGKYDLAGLYGRDNAVASGGASNGGNIDSYSAANAMRQQASLFNQGQMAVLDAHNNKISNVKGILEGLGVYLQNQDTGMLNTIKTQQSEGQRLFENDQTAKNNDVARKAQIAEVTGYAPDEWIASNNPYLNDDGTIKDQYKDVDFSVVMANAKKTGNTNAYNAAAVARYYKIMGDYGAYGKFDDGNYMTPGTEETAAMKQYRMQNDATLEALKSNADISKLQMETDKYLSDNDVKTSSIAADASKYQTDGTVKLGFDTNAKNLESNKYTADKTYDLGIAGYENELDQIALAGEIQSAISKGDSEQAYDILWNALGGKSGSRVSRFLDDVLHDEFSKEEPMTEEKLRKLCLNYSNINKYGYTADDVIAIFNALDCDTDGIKDAFNDVKAMGTGIGNAVKRVANTAVDYFN